MSVFKYVAISYAAKTQEYQSNEHSCRRSTEDSMTMAKRHIVRKQ